MNVSQQNKLNNLINLYLNDLADYGDSEQSYILAESTLNSVKQLIVETKGGDIKDILKEEYEKASPEKQEVLKDFMLYVKEI
jgi:hypothetical protein